MGLEALEIFKEVGGWSVLSKASNCFELAKLEVFGKASTVLLRLLQFSWIRSVAPLPRSGRLLSVGQQAATSVSPAMLQAVDFDLSGDLWPTAQEMQLFPMPKLVGFWVGKAGQKFSEVLWAAI